MFEARFANATLLKRILDAIKELVVDVNLLCTEEGIELQAMDAAHVALVNFTILADACTLYACTEPITLGINVVTFAKIVKCSEATDSVLLTHTKDGDTLGITFESANGSRKAEYGMKLMDIDSEHLEIPETTYACSVSLPSSEFSRLMKDMANFGTTVTLHVKEDVFLVETKGDMGLATVTVKQDKVSKQPTEIECSKETKMMFPLNYLVTFTKAQNISDQVSLYLSENIPIHVSYDMGDKGSIGYHLAPKLDE